MDALTAPMTDALDARRERFALLLGQHRGLLRKIAWGFSDCPADRADLEQDMAAQRWAVFPQWDGERPFATWAWRVALNVALSGRRGMGALDPLNRSLLLLGLDDLLDPAATPARGFGRTLSHPPRSPSMRLTPILATLLLAPLAAAPAVAADAPQLHVDKALVLGEAPDVSVSGLAPGEAVTVHGFRRGERWAETDGQWRATPTLAHAWARFRADDAGRIDVDAATPLDGSYAGADALGLLWSGFPADAPEVASLPRPDDALPADTSTWSLRVERNGEFIARRDVALRDSGETVRVEDVAFNDPRGDGTKAGVAGVFAAPAGATALPALILLHGSEGADPASARRWAGRMAERGFAAFALHYVAYDWNGGIEGVSPRFDSVPIETLDAARAWLATRSEVDASRIGVLGISKGAELALVGATRYPWMKAIVACVPSDSVWGGWGRAPNPGEVISSWSWQGAALPAIAYDNYEDAIQRRITWAALHERSRAALDAEAIAAARIPVERIEGRVLLIGGGRDEIWASLPMAEAVATTMRAAGKGNRVELLTFPEAGHGICNTGGRLERFDPVPTDPAVEARANAEAFARTVAFLREALAARESTPTARQ